MELPTHYLITPEPRDEAEFLAALKRTLAEGTRLLQFKGNGMAPAHYEALAGKVISLAHEHGCKVLLSKDPSRVDRLGADGLHLDSKELQTTGGDPRPVPANRLLAVSGHTLEALRQGVALGADLAVLSPVKATKAHPDLAPLGWEGLRAIADEVGIPVYALGGVSADDEAQALSAGARGIAGNRGYWRG